MLRGAAGALLAAALVTGCTSSSSVPARPATAAPSTALAPVTGFRVALESTEEPASGPAGAGKLAWRSTWQLRWEPVPDATGYAVWYATNEGGGNAPRAVQPETLLAVEAAAGTSTRARLEQDRRALLLLTSSQLLVAVAAEHDGRQGPRSPWFPVGDVPLDGVPIGTADVGHGEDR